MRETEISSTINTVYERWPATVDTSGKRALGTPSFQIVGLWEIYEKVDDELAAELKVESEVAMAQIMNWALFKVISEIGKAEDVVTPRDMPRASLLLQLERSAREPTLHPEIASLIRHIKNSGT